MMTYMIFSWHLTWDYDIVNITLSYYFTYYIIYIDIIYILYIIDIVNKVA